MTFSDRRSFLKKSIIGGATGLLSGSLYAQTPTPAEIEGPFYPLTPQKDTDFDLTSVKTQAGILQPLEDASVDIWQANSAGRYRHPHDKNPAPLDANFQGWAIVQSGKQGAFRFKTIMPGEYPASSSWTRPPHIHFKISKTGYIELVTQMYFPDNKFNETDLLLQRKPLKERPLMIAHKINDEPETYEYNIVLTAI